MPSRSSRNPAQSALKSVRAKIMKRLIVGLSGASGAIYGVRLLQVLRNVANVETPSGDEPGGAADPLSGNRSLLRDVQALADVVHDARDIAIASPQARLKPPAW